MADKIIMVDTSILIDFYRKTNKDNSVWLGLVRQGYEFAISAITKYEIYSGADQTQVEFWDKVLHAITVVPFDEASVDIAVNINSSLKRKRKQIDLADLFIAATAIAHNLPFSTLNRKHFDRIDELTIIE
jgi:tRNA(fMet)-specific endonuclease VapC